VLDTLKILGCASTGSCLTKSTFLRYNKSKNDVELHFGLDASSAADVLQKIPDGEVRQQGQKTNFVVTLPTKSFVSEVVNNIYSRPSSFWTDSPYTKDVAKEKVLVEFR